MPGLKPRKVLTNPSTAVYHRRTVKGWTGMFLVICLAQFPGVLTAADAAEPERILSDKTSVRRASTPKASAWNLPSGRDGY